SIFAAILDRNVGGHWNIRPAQRFETTRRYIDNTNVLETTFSTYLAIITVTDFMPVTSEQQKKERLWPEHELGRQIKCIHGEAEVLVDFDPRLDYGRASPKIKDCGELGWQIDTGRSLFILRGKLGSIRRDCQGLSGKMK